ncbi:hypothetical protein [Bacillus sp. 3255]|uniref:hypothetical protein n=1 Tax=Bacillus sp. 3255 TaxID=2817904 RepID=UPI00286287D7|nr:hypothetical protein [Bacillus sp. 3255]MDR6884103.1 hypothetical protein [Bacillus sp. 3255]
MLRKLFHSYKWRKLRVCIWKKRLHRQIQILSRRYSPAIPCQLHVTSGPFYGGSVLVDRQCRRATLFIHISSDRYLSSDERLVISRYSIKKNDLPYFILYHEFFHLLDTLDYLQKHHKKNLGTYQAALKAAVQQATNYRNLDVEQRADDFAYQEYVKQRKKAG